MRKRLSTSVRQRWAQTTLPLDHQNRDWSGFGLALGSDVMVILSSGFVTADLAVELVGQFINGGIKIGMGAFSKNIAALDMHIAFSPLSSFFFFHIVDGEQDFDVHYLVKMSGNPVQFACYITAQRGGNF